MTAITTASPCTAASCRTERTSWCSPTIAQCAADERADSGNVIHVFTQRLDRTGRRRSTHQPVEHLASLRYIPTITCGVPAMPVESGIAWKCAIERRSGPSCLVFSRQNLQHQLRDDTQLADVARGGYVLLDSPDARFDLILLATGSEVELAMQSARALIAQGRKVRVVSMPCPNVFDAQPLEWREAVLPSWCRKRVAIEAGITDYWRKYVGLDGVVFGIDTFGASAPAEKLTAFRIHGRADRRGGRVALVQRRFSPAANSFRLLKLGVKRRVGV